MPMASCSPNTVYADSEYFNKNRTDEERSKLREEFGDIPDTDLFEYSLSSVLKWGRPWWRICDIIYGRNARKDSLTDEDDLLAWKALLFTLASKLARYKMPARMSGTTSPAQWREDIFADAASWLWCIIRAARGKSLSIQDTAWIAITRACRSSGVQRVPEGLDRTRLNLGRVIDVADTAIKNVDEDEAESLLHWQVSRRLEYRAPEELVPGVKQSYKRVSKGRVVNSMDRRVRQLQEVHKRILRAKRS